MKFKWLKLSDRIIRLDRVHEFYVKKGEDGNFWVMANIFGSEPAFIDVFPTYNEAERFLNNLSYSLVEETLIDVEEIRARMEMEDGDFQEPPF
jgi:hypothetical protein